MTRAHVSKRRRRRSRGKARALEAWRKSALAQFGVITLNAADHAAFLAALDNPPEPTPKLVELMRLHGSFAQSDDDGDQALVEMCLRHQRIVTRIYEARKSVKIRQLEHA